jgi:hypothetical protein
MPATKQAATILLPDAAELSRTSRTALRKMGNKIADLRPALALEFWRDLSLKLALARL